MGFISKATGSILGTGDTTQANMIDQSGWLQNSAWDDQNKNNAFAEQLRQQAMNGTGPANTIFNNALSQGMNEAGSTISSAKGINPGLAARLAGEQAGQMAQNAVGQRAQMQLGAQQAYGQNNLAQQQILQGAIAGQNSANAGIAQGNNKANNDAVGGLMSGAGSAAMSFLNQGGKVPGTPKVSGDSLANDTVDAKLSPGEIVIPRSMAHDPEKAKAFIDEIMSKKKDAEPQGYGKVLAAHKKLDARVKKLEGKAA